MYKTELVSLTGNRPATFQGKDGTSPPSRTGQGRTMRSRSPCFLVVLKSGCVCPLSLLFFSRQGVWGLPRSMSCGRCFCFCRSRVRWGVQTAGPPGSVSIMMVLLPVHDHVAHVTGVFLSVSQGWVVVSMYKSFTFLTKFISKCYNPFSVFFF